MKFKKILATGLVASLLGTCFAGCSNNSNSSDKSKKDSGDKEIYFLNFKPEVADYYKNISAAYEKKTGIKVKVKTAASGQYETTLKSEITKSDAPTIFQINGPIGYDNWKNYCADLSDTELYKHLIDKKTAITDENGKGVYGIPYVMEGYGIIYNDAIMKKYFDFSDRAVSISSAKDIKDFDMLKKVAEDMQKNKQKLGIKGVFASTSMSAGNQWRWQTHLADVPFYYEFKQDAPNANPLRTGLKQKDITFKYNENFKKIFDLYIDNSCTQKGLLGAKSVDDSMAEFALGQVAMVQNGNWAWNQIKKVAGNVVKAENVKFLPIYTGMTDDSKQGLCIGTENFFAVNSKMSKEKQKASEDFLYWLFSSDEGKKFVTDQLGFIAPFNTFKEDETPDDPLAKDVVKWMNNKKVTTVPWVTAAFPSEKFKDDFGSALLEYVQGSKNWDAVKETVVNSWKAERTAAEK